MNIAIVISITSVLITLFFNLKNSKRTDTKDLTEQIKDNTRINIMLETISTTTQEIKTEVLTMRKEIQSHNERLIKVEESVKFAHERISDLTKRVEEVEDD